MAEPDTNKPSPDASQETGWAGIENHMKEYDEGEMKVLNDDIDALLIFAGLFSAVLTAFVVPSYLLLQPDNSQLSVQILDRISAQLARFEILPPFINSTAPDTSASLAFQVSTSARWMNCLWFLSLIFSLSSALFGILAKQWIREYLQWRKVAAAPRENVLLRQLRIEAWEAWKVSAGISAIPALLELAVVLFLAGLVVLVWTLDTVVAIVITAAVSVVIMVLCTVTVLPAVYRRCPYKSPTGWACVIIFDALTWVLRCIPLWATNGVIILRHAWRAMICLDLLRKLAKILRRWFVQSAAVPDERGDNEDGLHEDSEESPASERKSIPSFPRFPNWRERDLYIDDLGSSEISDFSDVGYPYLFDPDNTRRVAKDICEVMPLVRALSWVRKGTEDPRLLKHVATSVESLHTDRVDADDRYYVFMYVLRKLCLAKSKSRELKPLSALEGQLQSKVYKAAGKGHNMFRGGIYSGYDYLDLRGHLLDRSDLWVLAYLLLDDTVYGSGDLFDTQARLICLLRSFFSFPDSRYLDMGRTRLQKIYNDAIDSQSPSHRELRSSGVHTMILEILCSVSQVHMAEGTKRISADGPRISGLCIDNELHLAVQMFDQNAGYSDRFARHQFVMMADLVMRSLNECYFPDNDLMGTLLEKMSEAVTISLKEGYENCGCYHELPWIGSILTLRDSTHLMFDFSLDRLPAHPLWSLMEGLEKGLPAEEPNNQGWTLLTGENIRTDFFKLKGRVEMVRSRYCLAYGPMTDVDVSPSRSPVLDLSGSLSSKGTVNEDADTGSGHMQSGENDGADSEFYSTAAHPSQHSGGFHIEGALQARDSGLSNHTASNEHSRGATVRTSELEGLVDREGPIPQSSPQHSDSIVAVDRSDIDQPFSREPETGLSNPFSITIGDNASPTMPLPLSVSNSDVSGINSPSHDNTLHNDIQTSDNMANPDDPARLPSPIPIQPSHSMYESDAGRTITRNSSPSRDEDVQPAEHSWNSAEGSGETGESIEMTIRSDGLEIQLEKGPHDP